MPHLLVVLALLGDGAQPLLLPARERVRERDRLEDRRGRRRLAQRVDVTLFVVEGESRLGCSKEKEGRDWVEVAAGGESGSPFAFDLSSGKWLK